MSNLSFESWDAIRDEIAKQVAAQGQAFITGEVIGVDEARKMIYMAEFGDTPIPLFAFQHLVKLYMKTDPGTPVGSMQLWPLAVAPTNHLLAEGQTVSKTEWPELFDVHGYTLGGSGDNFVIPNWKGRTPVGHDTAQTEFDTLAEEGGFKTITLTALQSGLRSHSHSVTDPQHSHAAPGGVFYGPGVNWFTYGDGGGVVQAFSFTAAASTGISIQNATALAAQDAHSNLQPYKVAKWIIRGRSASGNDEPAVELKKPITTVVLPKKGDTVLVAREMGTRRLPRCLGVLQSIDYRGE
jgi:microcystin-dependent protein